MNSPPTFALLRFPPLYFIKRGNRAFNSPSLQSREGVGGVSYFKVPIGLLFAPAVPVMSSPRSALAFSARARSSFTLSG